MIKFLYNKVLRYNKNEKNEKITLNNQIVKKLAQIYEKYHIFALHLW